MAYDPGSAGTRGRSARVLTIVAPIVSAALLGFAFIAPPTWPAWTTFGLVSAALWLAWTLWAWPQIVLAERTLIVRNAMLTWAFPLREITNVEGGRKLTVSASDGSVVTASAVTDSDLTMDVIRNMDAYTQGGDFVRSADDLRLSARRSSTPTAWAEVIRARIQAAPADARGRIVRRVNMGIVLGTVAAVGLFLGTVTLIR